MRGHKMNLSIIIPCHNLEKHIAPLITTLNAQELFEEKVEVIFVLDSCTDKTREMIDLLLDAPQYESIQIYDAEVHSCGLAREIGREHATGEYIWFVDGDDWLMGMWVIKKIMNECDEKHRYCCIGCPFENVDCSYGSFEYFNPKDLNEAIEFYTTERAEIFDEIQNEHEHE